MKIYVTKRYEGYAKDCVVVCSFKKFFFGGGGSSLCFLNLTICRHIFPRLEYKISLKIIVCPCFGDPMIEQGIYT